MKNEKKNLLVFGYGLAVILSFFGIHHGLKHSFSFWPVVLCVLAGCFLIVTAMNYLLLKPVYKKWMVVAHAIGTVITTIILTVLFYTIFGVVGIILRILRKDLLNQKLDSSAQSYWIAHDSKKHEQDYYLQQF